MQYGWRRRNRVAKALRRGRPIADADLPVAAAIAAMAAKQRWLPVLYGGLTLLWLFNGLTAHGVRRWNGFLLAGLFVLLTPYLIWLRRRTVANYQRVVRDRAARTDPPQST